MSENELVLPEGDGIRGLSDQDLETYETRALAAIELRLASDTLTADDVTWATGIEQQIERVAAERGRRAADANAPAAAADIRARLAARTAPAAPAPVGNPADGGEDTTVPVEGELLTADGRPAGGAQAVHRQFGGLSGPKYRLNDALRGKGRNADQTFDPYAVGGGSLLSRAQQFAQVSQAEKRTDLSVLVASSDVPGFTQGGRLDSMDNLVRAMVQRARTLPVSKGNGQRVPVAQAQRKYAHTIDHRADLDQITEIMAMATDPAILTAAGGWCAALEVIWDLFNIVCTDGAVDLPIIGTPRGGLSWPVSASFGDISALPGVVWTWTNTMDVAAATGTGQSGTKPRVRVPCPDYTQAINDCDGVSVTVGNLTSDAFPELIANHLRLVEAIHAHYMNNRLILAMAAAGTPVNTTQTDGPASVDFLNVSAFYRRHLIEKYAMCDTAIIEGVYPRFARDMMKNDLRMTGAVSPSDTFCVSDEMLADWLDCAGIRAQFVADYQVRATGFPGAAGTPPTAWPATPQFMLYPAGTYAKLQGMTLDLGVVRDSTLNETNDHTAAWFEECWALAKIGHESLTVTLDTCVNGSRGALDQAACAQV
jgi:hypothetical protein